MKETVNVATPPSRPLSVRVSAETESANNSTAEDPMSPTGRVFEEMGVYIIVVMGLCTPVNLPVFRAGIETELLTRFPRFRSIQVMDGSKDGKPRWVQTVVNVDDHIIVPRLDLASVDSDPEKAVEDYVASPSLLPMDRRRPLWEFHFLDFPTSEAASTTVLRLHHSIGDGMSIITLLMASSRSTADPARLPAMPPPPKRTGAIYQRCPQPPRLLSGDYLAWLWSYFVLAWHTLVDIVLLAATVLFLRDPGTMFTLVPNGGQSRGRKRLVHQSLRLDDVKLIKTVMNCTMNDVLVGVTSAALSRYYFRKSCNINTKRICLRSILPVNTRPVSSRQTYVTKVETGNQISNIICPFYIALHNDPLEYVRTAKRSMHRKKSSLEVMFAQMTVDFLVKYFGPKALTMHYLNYGSNIKVILTVDDEQFPDCHQLLNDFAESVKLVRDAASLKTLTTLIQND
ncbi:hypothetical protein CFC21_033410 [Triticum aestivum]|uniref:Uncharacterized protein n=2 Tax=Triticum aestivum TaxID=4565 RepID=A0A3B6E9U2_WHEAT|nr:hypothetical protein CFC21_033410 [Triticum aestivum]